jgi:hypothetical protein
MVTVQQNGKQQNDLFRFHVILASLLGIDPDSENNGN